VAGCGRSSGSERASAPPGYETGQLRFEGATGQVSFAELAEDLGYLAPIKLNYVGNTISGPQNIQNVVTGDVDFGGAFNGAVIKLIAAGAPIKALVGYYGADAETWTGLYVREDSPIRAPRDLIGKKVAMNTLGAHMEFMLKEYLSRGGLSAEQIGQVTMVVIPPVNGEQVLRQQNVEVSALQGILRDKAWERGGLRLLVSDYQLFGEFTAGSYVMTNRFIASHPNTVRKFVQATAKAIEWARNTPRDAVIARYEDIVQRRGRNEDTSPLKYWKSTGIASKGGLPRDADFTPWIEWLVRDGQLRRGQIKVGDLYTTAFHEPQPGTAAAVPTRATTSGG
jgi:ABC-type nitrate/sulfonate/bicarbonate transport system substrate-binding protein